MEISRLVNLIAFGPGLLAIFVLLNIAATAVELDLGYEGIGRGRYAK
jgi:hypothetical protein